MPIQPSAYKITNRYQLREGVPNPNPFPYVDVRDWVQFGVDKVDYFYFCFWEQTSYFTICWSFLQSDLQVIQTGLKTANGHKHNDRDPIEQPRQK